MRRRVPVRFQPDTRQRACAYVASAGATPPTEDEPFAHASKRLVAYKRPRLIRFVAALPTTSTGKVMRRHLIELFAP
ncbi:AMP-binding enzyme [Mycobacterium sp. 48b]|uniref:AMP-binding enzyme n=1 Tax=Mycobacterium sp. 48b TaxID=3400426 RepID=UPI003AAC5F46